MVYNFSYEPNTLAFSNHLVRDQEVDEDEDGDEEEDHVTQADGEEEERGKPENNLDEVEEKSGTDLT